MKLVAALGAVRASHTASPTPNAAEAKLASLSLASWTDERAENDNCRASGNGAGEPGQRRIVQRESERKRRKSCEDRQRRSG